MKRFLDKDPSVEEDECFKIFYKNIQKYIDNNLPKTYQILRDHCFISNGRDEGCLDRGIAIRTSGSPYILLLVDHGSELALYDGEKLLNTRSISKYSAANYSDISIILENFEARSKELHMIQAIEKLRGLVPIEAGDDVEFLEKLYEHLYWAPGGPGAIKAEEEFSGLRGSAKN